MISKSKAERLVLAGFGGKAGVIVVAVLAGIVLFREMAALVVRVLGPSVPMWYYQATVALGIINPK